MARDRTHTVRVGDEDISLRITTQGARKLQAVTGKPLVNIFAAVMALDIDVIGKCLWVAMLPRQHDAKEKDGFDLLDRMLDENDDADLEQIGSDVLRVFEAGGYVTTRMARKGEGAEDEEGEGKASA